MRQWSAKIYSNLQINQSINQSINHLFQSGSKAHKKNKHVDRRIKQIHRIRKTEMTDIIKHHKSKHMSKHCKLSNGIHDRIKTHDEQTYANREMENISSSKLILLHYYPIQKAYRDHVRLQFLIMTRIRPNHYRVQIF